MYQFKEYESITPAQSLLKLDLGAFLPTHTHTHNALAMTKCTSDEYPLHAVVLLSIL